MVALVVGPLLLSDKLKFLDLLPLNISLLEERKVVAPTKTRFLTFSFVNVFDLDKLITQIHLSNLSLNFPSTRRKAILFRCKTRIVAIKENFTTSSTRIFYKGSRNILLFAVLS